MASPIEDQIAEHAGAVAGWIGGAAVAVLTYWKTRLRIRRDLREDGAEERAKRGDDVVDEKWRSIVEGLERQIVRLDAAVAEISRDFRMERAARLEAEDRAVIAERRAAGLFERVAILEQEVMQLRGGK